ncbi:peptidylprolyl isomerase [Microbacterium sp. zg.Y1090]|uniref:peptidylprolyl isomerase n=1 Tax=Microbacterium wangruii TaxID=3049073 RepID=UPI00214D5C90|nr:MULTISPECIES: peptidylprolyl isomerase [unclassified Microbacterium]MCR2819382.1 peptidylprolyl isomerase [Microbacterium sp. zg.Y1090]MDL5487299.1 peptidylprolyl isomerase [Microbacterium sp. zg-Y1211]WIM28362.1 peptidylprolyl isomerase [Microbacterium sp. zg-Y1090]
MRSRLLALPLLAASLLVLAGCAGADDTDAIAEPTPTAGADAATCVYTEAAGAVRDVEAPPAEPTVAGDVSATLETSAGPIAVTLDADRTPCTVGSFVALAEQGYYDDSTCHRLTTSGIFVLQCGDPSGTGRGGPGYSYADELDGTETYPAGTVAMANAGPDTNGSQFFLVYEDTQLPPNYTVFGQMDAAGLEVVQQIAAAGAEGGAPDGPPATPVTITDVVIG